MKEENSDFTFYLEYASSYALETSAFLSQDRQVGEGGTELCGDVSLVGNIPGLDFFCSLVFGALRIYNPRKVHHGQAQDGQGLSLFCGKTGNHRCMLRCTGFRKECLSREARQMSAKLSVPGYSWECLPVSPGESSWKAAGLTVTVSFMVTP